MWRGLCTAIVECSNSWSQGWEFERHEKNSRNLKKICIIVFINSCSCKWCSIWFHQVYVFSFLLEVIVFQTYANQSSVPIEARYIFPLDDKAAVCGFEAFINGKHIVGEVRGENALWLLFGFKVSFTFIQIFLTWVPIAIRLNSSLIMKQKYSVKNQAFNTVGFHLNIRPWLTGFCPYLSSVHQSVPCKFFA